MPGKNKNAIAFPALFFLAWLIAACSNPVGSGTEKPLSADSIIPRDQLVVITADVHIAEAIINLDRIKGVNERTDAERYYRFVWTKYHITHDQFLRNIERLKKNPEDFSNFYDEVIKNLEAREAVIPTEKK